MESLDLFSELKFSWEKQHSCVVQDADMCLRIEGDEMVGTVEKTDIEPGLVLYSWKLKSLQNHRTVFEFMGDVKDKTYMLTYHFEPPVEKIIFTPEGGPDLCSKEKPFLILHSNEKPLTTSLREDCELQCLSVCFSHSWLARQLSSLRQEQNASDLLLQLVEATNLRALSKGEAILSKALFSELESGAFAVEVKAHLYNLITFFYRHVRIRAFQDTRSQYQAILSRVEKQVMASLYTSLPPVNELAKEYYMSFSSLNRHFKEQYGATIYDYYLEQKMLLAEQLIKEGNQPVTAVAFQLGYESLTHFISIFKKIHGYSPGQLKKKGAEKDQATDL